MPTDTPTPVLVVTDTTTTPYHLSFSWRGGAYIDIHFDTVADGAFEVINVWDYAAGQAEIPFTRAAMKARCREWLDDMADELPNYAENARY